MLLEDNNEKLNSEEEAAASAGTTNEEVVDSAHQANTTIDNNTEEIAKAMDKADPGANAGAPGVTVVEKTPVIGKLRTIDSMATIGKGAADGEYELEPNPSSVSDFDAKDKLDNAAADTYYKIQAKIVHEASQPCEQNGTHIIGNAVDGEVYSRETRAVEDEITNENLKAPITSPKFRNAGTDFDYRPAIFDATGAIIGGLDDKMKEKVVNGSNPRKPALFNMITPDMKSPRVVAGKFVEPRTGKFLIIGINPLAKDTKSNFAPDDTPLRTENVSSGSHTNNGLHKIYRSNGHNELFQVVDITSDYKTITACSDKLKETMIASKSKLQLGFYEAVDHTLDTIDEMFKTEQQRTYYREFDPRGDRCSLFYASRTVGGDNSIPNASCFNERYSFIKFMEQLKTIELLQLYGMSAPRNFIEPIKFHKGQRGNVADNFFYRKMSGCYAGQDKWGHDTAPNKNIKMANAVPFLRYKGSPSQFNNEAKCVKTFKALYQTLDSIRNLYKDDPGVQEIMSMIGIIENSFNDLIAKCEWGKACAKDTMTSFADVKMPSFVDLVVDVNPNDLVQCVVEITDGDAEATSCNTITKWYPVCGYYNVTIDLDVRTSPYEVYYVIPTTLKALCEWLNDYRTNELFFQDLTTAARNQYASDAGTVLADLISPKQVNARRKFIPLQMNSPMGKLGCLMIGEAMRNYTKICMEKGNTTRDGYLKWHRLLHNFAAYGELFNKFYGKTLLNLVTELDDAKYDIDASINEPARMPVLSSRAKKLWLEDSTTIMAEVSITASAGADAKLAFALLEPSKFTANLLDLRSFAEVDVNEFDENHANAKSTWDMRITDNPKYANRKVQAIVNDLFTVDGESAVGPTLTRIGESDMYFINDRVFMMGNTETGDLEDYAIRAKVPQYDADLEFLGSDESKMGDQLYGEDKYLIDNCDCYIAVIKLGRYADNTTNLPGEQYKFRGEFMMCPAILLSQALLTAKTSSFSTLGRAKYNVRTSVISQGTPDGQINFDVPTYAGDSSDVAITIATKALLRPSMYGFKHTVWHGLTYVDRDGFDRVGCVELMPAAYNSTNIGGVANAGNKMKKEWYDNERSYATDKPLMQSLHIGYLPHINGLNLAGNGTYESDWNSSLASETADEDIAAPHYYSRQMAFCGGVYGGPLFTGDHTQADTRDIYDQGKYCYENFVDLSNRLYSADIYTKLTKASWLHVYWKVRYDEQLSYLFEYRHAKAFGYTRLVNPKEMSENQWLPNILFVEPDVLYHASTLGDGAYNDTRDWMVGRPTKSLTRRLYARGNTLNVFAEKYNINKN